MTRTTTPIASLTLGIASAFLTGCGAPRVEPIEAIQPNETAYVLPLEGENVDSQAKFESIDYLNQKKIAAKRVVIPIRKRSIGYMPWSYEWIPTVMVIKVDRTPVTREWTVESRATKPIAVESKDSIGFSIGVNITAYIDEADTSKFLYRYRAKSLAEVIDTNIRSDIQSVLSEEFGTRNLEQCKSEKTVVFNKAREVIIPKYKDSGITISTLGMSEGLSFDDKEIQDAINQAYTAEMNIKRQEQEKHAQLQINDRLLSIARNEREQAEEFAKAAEARKKMVDVEVQKMQAEAMLNFSQKWNGQTPQFVTIGGSGNANPFLFTLPAPKSNE